MWKLNLIWENREKYKITNLFGALPTCRRNKGSWNLNFSHFINKEETLLLPWKYFTFTFWNNCFFLEQLQQFTDAATNAKAGHASAPPPPRLHVLYDQGIVLGNCLSPSIIFFSSQQTWGQLRWKNSAVLSGTNFLLPAVKVTVRSSEHCILLRDVLWPLLCFQGDKLVKS